MTHPNAVRNLPLAGSMDRARRWMIALSSIPFLGAVIALALVAAHAGNGRGAPPLFLLAAIPAAILIVQYFVVRSMRNAGASVEQGDLVIRTGFGTRRIALTHLRKHGLRLVDLAERSELKPWLRTMGTGLPGYSAGWFRLRNGERALCLLLDRRRVSYLRSDGDNLSLLLSLQEPEMLRALLERQG